MASKSGTANKEKSNGSKDPTKLDRVMLTNEERLELENIQLRNVLLEQQRQDLSTKQREWGARVAERLGINLSEYSIDTNTGACQRVQVGGGQ